MDGFSILLLMAEILYPPSIFVGFHWEYVVFPFREGSEFHPNNMVTKTRVSPPSPTFPTEGWI